MSSTTFQVPGPCSIEYGDADIGVTKSGVIIRGRTNWRPVTDDKHGEEPADFILAGKGASVEVTGLEVVALKAANIWDASGGLFGSLGVGDIGDLASAVGLKLEIIENNGTKGSDSWCANKAVPIDPDTLTLVSTVELNMPLVFLIVPDDNDKLFLRVPTYVQ